MWLNYMPLVFWRWLVPSACKTLPLDFAEQPSLFQFIYVSAQVLTVQESSLQCYTPPDLQRAPWLSSSLKFQDSYFILLCKMHTYFIFIACIRILHFYLLSCVSVFFKWNASPWEQSFCWSLSPLVSNM